MRENTPIDTIGSSDAVAGNFWNHSADVDDLLKRIDGLNTSHDGGAESLIFSLAHEVESRAPYGKGHGLRVSNYAVRFGKSLGLSHDDLETLRIAGLIHDVGKIGVPASILSKPDPLNFEEKQIVEQHTIIGERICLPIASFHHVLPIIRHHHERLDGSGYPDGLRSEQIPLTVRIIQIVDICDALSTDRPYRKNLSLPLTLATLFEDADRGWLDETLLRQFACLIIGTENSLALNHRERRRAIIADSRVAAS